MPGTKTSDRLCLDQKRGECDVRRRSSVEARRRDRLVRKDGRRIGRGQFRHDRPRDHQRERMHRINPGGRERRSCPADVGRTAVSGAAVRRARELAVLAARHLGARGERRGESTLRPEQRAQSGDKCECQDANRTASHASPIVTSGRLSVKSRIWRECQRRRRGAACGTAGRRDLVNRITIAMAANGMAMNCEVDSRPPKTKPRSASPRKNSRPNRAIA